MLYAVAIVFIVIFPLEAAATIIGNVFTIFVFKTQSRLHLKRTYLLLINLAVADLLAGVGEVCVLVFHRIPRTEIKSLSVWWAVQVFGLSVSLMFLALISLERVYAVFWPLRHRVTSARAYNFSIVIAWVIGLCLTGLSVFVDSISHQCGYRLCRCCCWFAPFYFARHNLCKLPIYSIATVRYTTWLTRWPKKLNARPEYATFKDILHSGCNVAYFLASCFPRVQCQRILWAVFFFDVALVW